MAFNKTYNFADGTVAVASQVNQNFDDCVGQINDNIDALATKADLAGDNAMSGKNTFTDETKVPNVTLPDSSTNAANTKFVNDAVAARSAGQQIQVEGTTNLSTTSGSFIDMTDMSITITTNGGNVLLMFSGSFDGDNEWGWKIRFEEGTNYYGESWSRNYRYYEEAVSRQYLVTSLAAGTYTFKVQWSNYNGTARQLGATSPRVFTAIEYPS